MSRLSMHSRVAKKKVKRSEHTKNELRIAYIIVLTDSVVTRHHGSQDPCALLV